MLSGLARWAAGPIADAAKIVLDQPGGGYDRFHALLERTVKLPDTRTQRGWLVTGAVVLRHLLFGKPSPSDGPLRTVAAEVADDTFVETLKRVVEPGAADAATPPAAPSAPAVRRARLTDALNAFTGDIAPWMGQERK